MSMKPKKIILFDGMCNFCDSTVNFIISHDPDEIFIFAPLQSSKGKELLQQFGLSTESFDSLVLLDGNRCYTKSTAALHIAKHLNGFLKIFYGFIIIPKPIRDFFYQIIAKNRYKWFGQKKCSLPSENIKKRFLQ
ncbi:thiol-disulfide oxidoreductase DCC family protein [Aeribacillus pallidus]|nr:thiol-disulfide oxidoreductase DCC family protein [Aeribacillus pallidus]RZI52006.1 thiol-disulfide oxidoreductase DCC family protein [Aeribacillus pallidus]